MNSEVQAEHTERVAAKNYGVDWDLNSASGSGDGITRAEPGLLRDGFAQLRARGIDTGGRIVAAPLAA